MPQAPIFIFFGIVLWSSLFGNKSLKRLQRSPLPAGVSEAESALPLAGCITAVRIILRHWKSQVRSSFTDWLRLMTDTASFEELIARLNDGRGKFYNVWSHFLRFIQYQLTSAPWLLLSSIIIRWSMPHPPFFPPLIWFCYLSFFVIVFLFLLPRLL